MTRAAVDLAPAEGAERLELLDAVRGFALAGVLLVNTGALTLSMYLPPAARAALPTAAFDAWARPAIATLASGKFITLFSILFGVGFAVQLGRADARGRDVAPTYARRLLVLLAIGLAHWWLVWWGDVLRLYAVLGFALLLVRRARPRTLLVAGLALGCLGQAALAPLVEPAVAALRAALPTAAEANARALAVYSGNDYAAVVRFNPVYDGLYLSREWFEPLGILARLLLGVWAGRTLLLHDPEAHRSLLRRLVAWGLPLGIAGNALVVLGAPLPRPVLEVVTGTSAIALAAAYAAGFALLFLRPAWRARLAALAPVGRMALTNYLTQSVVGIALFYGIGLGIGPRFGVPGRLALWAALFGAQMALSAWWLARFRFGPAEWVWRSLTYGRAQPMRLALTARRDDRAAFTAPARP